MLTYKVLINKSLINHIYKYMNKKSIDVTKKIAVLTVILAGVFATGFALADVDVDIKNDNEVTATGGTATVNQSQSQSQSQSQIQSQNTGSARSSQSQQSAQAESQSQTQSASATGGTATIDQSSKISVDVDKDGRNSRNVSKKRLPATGSGAVGLIATVLVALTGAVVSAKKYSFKNN
jgi:hypothetical protein